MRTLFLPAEARNTIARPADRLLYDPADLMQRAITGKMTKAVIEMFEIIYVDQGDRKRPFFSTATAHFGADEALHAPPIGKAGQRVRFRQFLQFGVEALQLLIFARQIGDAPFGVVSENGK